MNSLHIIGRLTKDPEIRTTQSGVDVCSFDVAVNRKKTQNNQNPGADYFHVSAWRELGKICEQYLSKGKLVSVVGPVSVRAYTNNNGEARASLDVTADSVEFLSPRNEGSQPAAPEKQVDQASGFEKVETDELPF